MVTVVKGVVTAKSFSLAIGFKTMLVITKIFRSSFDCFVHGSKPKFSTVT